MSTLLCPKMLSNAMDSSLPMSDEVHSWHGHADACRSDEFKLSFNFTDGAAVSNGTIGTF